MSHKVAIGLDDAVRAFPGHKLHENNPKAVHIDALGRNARLEVVQVAVALLTVREQEHSNKLREAVATALARENQQVLYTVLYVQCTIHTVQCSSPAHSKGTRGKQ